MTVADRKWFLDRLRTQKKAEEEKMEQAKKEAAARRGRFGRRGR
jgi:hypothetical protein